MINDSKNTQRNRDWVNPHDPEARITKMKDGRTHLAYKAEHAVDLETGALVALTIQPGDCGDTTSMRQTLAEAGEAVTALAGQGADATAVGPVAAVSAVGVERVVADKGYHSKRSVQDLVAVGVGTVIAEPERKRQKWKGQKEAQAAVYGNRRRLGTKIGKAFLKKRGELLERSFAHVYDSGGMRRVHLRGNENIAKRALLQGAAFNLSLILRQILQVGTARQTADLRARLCLAILWLGKALARENPRIPEGEARPSRFQESNRTCRSHRQIGTLSTGC